MLQGKILVFCRTFILLRAQEYRLLRASCIVFFIKKKFPHDQNLQNLLRVGEEHNRSSIGQQLQREHGITTSVNDSQFTVLKKCRSKFDCLVYEMLFIQKIRPNLNVQSDSVRGKRFV